jgi:hypothetical protein
MKYKFVPGVILLVVAVALLCLPMAVYVWTFGTSITADHARWAEFGSAMSGAYAPVVALATLVVLAFQVRLQAQQVRLQQQMNEHEYDQAHIQQWRSDLEFYVQHLVGTLSTKTRYGNTISEILIDRFRPADAAALHEPRLRDVAMEIDSAEPRCLALWFAIYPILVGFESGTGTAFEVNKVGSKQKMIAMLGADVCVAMDNYHHVRTGGRLKKHYAFSAVATSST